MTAIKNLDRALLAATLCKQLGVITRAQTTACGMGDSSLRHRLRDGGPWQRMLPGIYLANSGSPTIDQRDMAALLYGGPGSVITGYSAIRRIGMRAPHVEYIDVLIPAKRMRKTSEFVRIQRSVRMPEQVCVSGGIRFAMAARAVADAARRLEGLRDVRAVVADSVQQGWCKISELQRELSLGPVAGSALLRRVLGEVAEGVRSVAEGDLQDLIKQGRLPVPVFNARLYVAKVLLAVADAWWREAGVVAEVDSREWHLSPEEWERTLQRHAKMSAHGILVLHFTPKQLRTERAQVIATIKAALEAGRAAAQVRALPPTG
jgi:very-short-patch-repair endonuclease